MAHLYYDDTHLIGNEELDRCAHCLAPFYPSQSDAPHDEFCCATCEAEDDADARRGDLNYDEPDEAYERAAARARSNDFEDTNGRDWT